MTTMHEFSKRYEKLPVLIYDDQQQAAAYVVENILEALYKKEATGEKLVLALTANPAAIPVYELLAQAYEAGRSFKNVIVFGIDEYYPIQKTQLQSHYRFLREYLFDVLDIPEKQIFCLDGEVSRAQVQEHCLDFEKKIVAHNGIDILVTSRMGSMNRVLPTIPIHV